MKNNNPLKKYVDSYFDSVNYIHGITFHLGDYFKQFKKLFDDKYKDSDFHKYISAGTCIPIRKLDEFPSDGWARYYPTGSFQTKGAEYFKAFEDIKNNNYGWVISQAFEGFEDLLYEMLSMFLLNNNHFDRKKIKPEKNPNYLKYESSSLEYWQGKVRYDFYKPEELLKYIRKISEHLVTVESNNNRNLDLCSWFFISARVRNIIVHQRMIFDYDTISEWDQNKKSILEYYYPGIHEGDFYQIHLTAKSVEESLKIFLEYFYLIFESLSILAGYDHEIIEIYTAV